MKKVEELHPHIEEAEEEEDVIDIEAKPEITFQVLKHIIHRKRW